MEGIRISVTGLDGVVDPARGHFIIDLKEENDLRVFAWMMNCRVNGDYINSMTEEEVDDILEKLDLEDLLGEVSHVAVEGKHESSLPYR